MALTRAQKAWMAYDPAVSAYAMIVRTVAAPIFLSVYAADIMGAAKSTEYWGYVCSFAGLTAGALSVGLGPWIDAKHKKVQAVALFTLLGVISSLSYIAVPYINLPSAAPYVILGISFIGMLGFMGANSFYDSLLVDITAKAERNRISSYGFALGYGGALISFLLCLVFSFIQDGKWFFTGAFLITALWWGAGSIPLFKCVRESGAERTAVNLADTLKFIWKNKNILLFLIAYFLYIDGVGTIMLQATLIAKALEISDTHIMITILALQVIGLPFTLLAGGLAKKFSAKTVVLAAVFIYLVICGTVTYISFASDMGIRQLLFFVTAGLIGTAQGGIQSLSRSLFSQIIPVERAAELFAVYNIFGRFTTIVGPLLMIPVAVHLWGKPELGISLMMIPFICGALVLTKVKVTEN